MDQVTLVENQIADGQLLVEELIKDGFQVTAASWMKTSDDGQWFLYLASPIADTAPLKAYGRVHTVARRMPQPFLVGPLDIKLIGPTEPVAKAILEVQRRYPRKSPLHLGESTLAGVSIEGAYIYPPVTAAA